MENNGTAILLNVKAKDGGDLILVVDQIDKIVSLVELAKSGALHVKISGELHTRPSV